MNDINFKRFFAIVAIILLTVFVILPLAVGLLAIVLKIALFIAAIYAVVYLVRMVQGRQY